MPLPLDKVRVVDVDTKLRHLWIETPARSRRRPVTRRGRPAQAARRRRLDRPWSVLAAGGTAAHHVFELSSGVGLVLQPELGLPGAAALWGAQLPLWALAAARGGRRWDPLLAVASGASFGGVAVHFLLWPSRMSRIGLPMLTEAEGLPAAALPAYNAVLWLWGTASLVSVITEIGGRRRAWALVGLASLPAMRWSARHHFAWASERAAVDPRWWNRGLQGARQAGVSARAGSR